MKVNKIILSAMLTSLILTACGNTEENINEDTEPVSVSASQSSVETDSEAIEKVTDTIITKTEIKEAEKTEIITEESSETIVSESEVSTEITVSEIEGSSVTTVNETEQTVFTDDFDEEAQVELADGQSIVIKDLNGDGRREKIYNYNPFGLCDITYYDSSNAKQTVHFGVMSVWGGTWYLNDAKQILNLKFFAHSDGTGTGFEMDIYDFGSADIKLLHTYSADGGYALYDVIPSEMTYQINGKEISSEDFVSETTALSELCEKELGYPLFIRDERNEDNYIINYELTNNCGCNMLS